MLEALREVVQNWGPIDTEQDHFELIVRLPETESVRLTLKRDGTVVPADEVYISGVESADALLDVEFTLSEITSSSSRYDPVALPHEFGVYVWYVSPTSSIDVSGVDPRVRETLEALGYLN